MEGKAGFTQYLADEIQKVKGVAVPIRSGFLRRMLVRRLACGKIHPNPDDEFCKPEVGPNNEIISRYVRMLKNVRTQKSVFEERLIVERIKPDGYMLLNGHHRWAAAMIVGRKRVPVKLVNLTHEMDVQRMLWNSEHTKRAALDLDEVVFASGSDPAEKGLLFPLSLRYTERLRLGIPALFRFLNVNGYDIWVYSSSYYSLEYVRMLFRLYHVQVTGIVTGIGKKQTGGRQAKTKIERMIANKYNVTLSIDRETLLSVDNQARDYQEYKLNASDAGWSSEVIDKIAKFEKA